MVTYFHFFYFEGGNFKLSHVWFRQLFNVTLFQLYDMVEYIASWYFLEDDL
jgi:hypothetical protein